MSPRFAEEYDEPRWLLKALREAAHELESQLWGLDEDDLRWRPSDDAWSLKEIAAHLRDCEEHFIESLEAIASRDRPRLRSGRADHRGAGRRLRQVAAHRDGHGRIGLAVPELHVDADLLRPEIPGT